ncbi:MAG: DMT family protein [Myxococcota bacterium]
MRTLLLLVASNVFMTFAWYGHLRFKETALWKVILVSWGIAFFEYCLQVPANRWGHGTFSVVQLKVLQEVLSLAVFAAFSVWWLRERLSWNHAAAFGLLALAVYLVFLPTPGTTVPAS